MSNRCIAIGPVLDDPMRDYDDHARAVASGDLTFVLTMGSHIWETYLTPDEYEVVFRVLVRAREQQRPALPSELIGRKDTSTAIVHH